MSIKFYWFGLIFFWILTIFGQTVFPVLGVVGINFMAFAILASGDLVVFLLPIVAGALAIDILVSPVFGFLTFEMTILMLVTEFLRRYIDLNTRQPFVVWLLTALYSTLCVLGMILFLPSSVLVRSLPSVILLSLLPPIIYQFSLIKIPKRKKYVD